jgi:hypothetical protein
MEQFIATQM